jgi:hypothetical protein
VDQWSGSVLPKDYVDKLLHHSSIRQAEEKNCGAVRVSRNCKSSASRQAQNYYFITISCDKL